MKNLHQKSIKNFSKKQEEKIAKTRIYKPKSMIIKQFDRA